MCFHVLLQVVVQLEATIALIAAEHVVQLGNLDLDNFDILQHFGGSDCFLLINNLLLETNKAGLTISCIELCS